MEKLLLKFFDNDIDFERFLLVKEEDLDRIAYLLVSYRKSDEEYNWDDFVLFLRDNKVEFDTYPVEEIYF